MMTDDPACTHSIYKLLRISPFLYEFIGRRELGRQGPFLNNVRLATRKRNPINEGTSKPKRTVSESCVVLDTFEILRSKYRSKIKNRMKKNRRLTANTSHIRFFIWIGNALKMLKLDYSCGVKEAGKKHTPNLEKMRLIYRVEINFELTSSINDYHILVVLLRHQQG